ncbi:MAG TPA: hypothetical protein VF692_11135 [Pyrinomonadaceae bacterium]|jgi:hypothetical protein
MRKQLTEKQASGMTVNERLYLSGLLDDFENAAKQRNKKELKSILEKVYLNSENIEAIIEDEFSKN